MDLMLNTNRNVLQFSREKKTKSTKESNKTVSFADNNQKEISCCGQEVDEELKKSFSFDVKSIQSDRTDESSGHSVTDSVSKSDLEKKWQSKRVFEELLELFANKFKLSVDYIHERYVAYSQQNQTQRDSTKTDYTYAKSFSYNRRVGLSRLFEWSVPNMSRKSITASVRSSTQTTRTSSSVSNVEISNSSSDFIITNEKSEKSMQMSDNRGSTGAQMFTRSQCLGGAQCVAGCEVHKKVRRRGVKSAGILIPNSGQGIEPEIEFSDDDDCALNNRLNYERLNNYRQNGCRTNTAISGNCESEDEEVTIVRKVTNIFRTTVNNTSKLISSVTPRPVKRITSKCPSLWLPLALAILLVPSLYLTSHLISSPLSENSSLDRLSSDMSANEAMTALVKELKDIKLDLQTLRQSNSDLKHRLNGNELDGNEKWTEMNGKIDSIESHLNNVLKNCCKNETDSLLALIDWRLSAFMASMLNQKSRHSMSASEAAQELKAFIASELSHSNDILRESIEQKLMSSIERVEREMSHKSSAEVSSDITIDEIKSLIRQALAIYDADKTGQADFALEPAGGTVINTRCSETFDPYGVQYKIFGMPVWSSSVSPRAVIQPTISPGECWAFKGSTGHLVIRLSQVITPTAFSYEHIPKQISRDGNIDSAPKELQVRALDDESDTAGHLLGNYVYEDNGSPMQYFPVQHPNPRPVQYIELVVLSNHGHTDYTCLYRFRVHGNRVNY